MNLDTPGLRIEALTNQTFEVNRAIKWIFARNRLAQIGLVESFPDSENAAADFTIYMSLGFAGRHEIALFPP
jgi:hypothetical protein